MYQAVEGYIYFYNYQRFQAKLNQSAPIKYRHALAAQLFSHVYLRG
ncbi:IS3 family transposase [Paenibacillus typhae]